MLHDCRFSKNEWLGMSGPGAPAEFFGVTDAPGREWISGRVSRLTVRFAGVRD